MDNIDTKNLTQLCKYFPKGVTRKLHKSRLYQEIEYLLRFGYSRDNILEAILGILKF